MKLLPYKMLVLKKKNKKKNIVRRTDIEKKRNTRELIRFLVILEIRNY